MRGPRFVAPVLYCVQYACGGVPAGAPAAAPSTSAAATTPLAAVVAAGVCPELLGRVFPLASADDGITDTYVTVKKCVATAAGEEVRIVADAYAWLAVDRDFGAVGVHGFVHATVHGDVRLQAHARYADDRLVVTFTPRAATSIAVEPVGALDLVPLNWASFLALEVAPAAGASPEALAKTKLRDEAERTLATAIARPFVVSYDARSGSASLGAPRSGAMRVRVVPNGTVLLGPFPPSTAAHVPIRVAAGRRVAARAVCRTHAERILDADRRGDAVSTDAWAIVEGDARPALGETSCPWMLAVRARDDAPAVAELDLPLPATGPALEAPDRWVSIDEAVFEATPEDYGITVVLASDVWRRGIDPRAPGGLPAIVVLAPDQDVWVRAERRADGKNETVAESRLALDAAGDTNAAIVLATRDGRRVATVRVRARVRLAEATP